MRVLFTTLREKSHFLPLLPFIDAFQRGGHEVGVAAPPDLAERVAATGATFLPFGHPGDEGMRPYWARLHGNPGGDINRIVMSDIFAGVCAETALPGLLDTLGSWRPALVARETHEFAGLVAAEKAGIPHVRIAITSRPAEDETVGFVTASVDGHRRTLGLPPDPHGERLRDEVALTLFPASFESIATPPARRLRFRTARPAAPPLPDWWGGRADPFVYVTLGTVAGRFGEMQAHYRATLEAIGALPVRALLTIGNDLPLELLGTVPANVHVERFVPQDQVLPHAALVFNHGGSGTVQGALAAGVPQIVAPLFADQPHNAAQVTSSGVGLGLPVGGAPADQVRRAIAEVLERPVFRAAAQKIAAEIAALPLIDESAAAAARLAAV